MFVMWRKFGSEYGEYGVHPSEKCVHFVDSQVRQSSLFQNRGPLVNERFQQ